jgi:CO/xanthine dehydrogenase Mo-binding subunit
VISQLLADYFGCEMSDVRVVPQDSLSAPPHFGPGGSRLGVAITGAVLGACDRIRQKMAQVVAALFRTEPAQIVLRDGKLGIPGVEQAQMTVAQVAGTMLARSDLLPEGVDPRPEATHVWTAPGRTPADEQGRAKSYLTAAQAVHVVQVEIDRETGFVTILSATAWPTTAARASIPRPSRGRPTAASRRASARRCSRSTPSTPTRSR